MGLGIIVNIVLFGIVKATISDNKYETAITEIPDNVFNGVYSECFLHLSYSCLQKKTLLYLKELNNLSEVSVIGDYVKFVKIKSNKDESEEEAKSGDTEELAFMIDEAIDKFFDNHVLKFYALGRNISVPRSEEFVGRKKRKGGGGGEGGGHDGGGHDDGGKKKMMMMAMMCMKMKLMMMVPAMMGIMGMMSFKGMMFSMMSFMISKMMLLMKILEKKGGLGGGGSGGGLDGGWAAGGGGNGAWMPAGGQDYGGGGGSGVGGGGGGYDANGQWQSRSILETPETYKTIEELAPKTVKTWHTGQKGQEPVYFTSIATDQWKVVDEDPNKSVENKPSISFVKPKVRVHNKIEGESYKKPVLVYKRANVNFEFDNFNNDLRHGNEDSFEPHNSRQKRGVSRNNLKKHPEDKPYNSKNTLSLKDGYGEGRKIPENKYINADKDFVDTKSHNRPKIMQRQKRGLLDLLQNAYVYWTNTILGKNSNRRTNFQRFKIVNGVKYVYHPYKIQKPKMPRELPANAVKDVEDLQSVVAVEDFNKGEIVEGGMESRTHKKFHKMKDTVNDTMEDNPWE